jgi:hypothetical protein
MCLIQPAPLLFHKKMDVENIIVDLHEIHKADWDNAKNLWETL